MLQPRPRLPLFFFLGLLLSLLTGQSGCPSDDDDSSNPPQTATPGTTPVPVTGLLELYSPWPDQTLTTSSLSVYFGLGAEADTSSYQVILDELDVTDQVSFDATTRTGRGSSIPLSRGPHRLTVHVASQQGSVATAYADFTAYPGQALVRQVRYEQELIDGPESRGRLGDWLLDNGRVQILISDVGRYFEFLNLYGGHVMDADRVRQPWEAERDGFGGMVPAVNIESSDHPVDIEVVNDGTNGAAAVIRTTGPDDPLSTVNPSTMAPLLIPAELSGVFGTYIPFSADDKDLPLEITSTYTLEPNVDYLRYDTQVVNQGGQAISIYLGDYLNASGEMDYFSPGLGFRASIYFRHEGDFFGYAGYASSARLAYGVIPESQPATTIALPGTILSFYEQDAQAVVVDQAAPSYTLNPGQSVTLRRYLVIGEDIGDVGGVRCDVLSLGCGTLSGRVTQAGQPVANAQVTAYRVGGVNKDRTVISHWRTKADGTYSGRLETGHYSLAANLPDAPYPGNDKQPPTEGIDIKASAPASGVDFDFPASGHFEVVVVDELNLPIPAKVTLVGFDPSQDPLVHGIAPMGYDDTGAMFSDVFADPVPYGVAKVALAGPNGRTGSIAVEPGEYELVVSRGPFYSLFRQRVYVPPDPQGLTVNAQIAKVVDTSGYLAGDFHVHGIDSLDAAVPRDWRLTGLAAEALDVFGATEHGFRVDFANDIKRLALDDRLVALIGEEVTTFDLGHFNGFPLASSADKRNLGGVDWGGKAAPGQGYTSNGTYDMSLSELIASLQGEPGEQVFMANHVNTSTLGYFSMIGLDTGISPPEAVVPACMFRQDPTANLFADGFNAMELWRTYEDNMSKVWDENLGDWFNLLNQGMIRTSMANSDTHASYLIPPGGPRSLIAVDPSMPLEPTQLNAEVPRRINEGRVIDTDGPLLKVELEASSTGARAGLSVDKPLLVQAKDGKVKVLVSVQSAAWVGFDRIEIFVNTVPTPTLDEDDGPGRTYPFTSCGNQELTVPDVPRYAVSTPYTYLKDQGFTIQSVVDYPEIPGATHLETSLELPLTLTQDAWVIVLVRGTDGVTSPLFPVLPAGLEEAGNETLDALMDGNLGQGGVLPMAFTNPLFVDVDGNGRFDPQGLARLQEKRAKLKR